MLFSDGKAVGWGGGENSHSPPSSMEVKNAWRYFPSLYSQVSLKSFRCVAQCSPEREYPTFRFPRKLDFMLHGKNAYRPAKEISVLLNFSVLLLTLWLNVSQQNGDKSVCSWFVRSQVKKTKWRKHINLINGLLSVIFFYNLTVSQTTRLDTQKLPQVIGCLEVSRQSTRPETHYVFRVCNMF